LKLGISPSELYNFSVGVAECVLELGDRLFVAAGDSCALILGVAIVDPVKFSFEPSHPLSEFYGLCIGSSHLMTQLIYY